MFSVRIFIILGVWIFWLIYQFHDPQYLHEWFRWTIMPLFLGSVLPLLHMYHIQCWCLAAISLNFIWSNHGPQSHPWSVLWESFVDLRHKNEEIPNLKEWTEALYREGDLTKFSGTAWSMTKSTSSFEWSQEAEGGWTWWNMELLPSVDPNNDKEDRWRIG